MSIAALAGLAPLAHRYDGFVLDLWGVIHDGVTPYPGAVDCLEHLRERGARVVLLSNAPRRAAAAATGLRRLGIADGLYYGLVTSGEATWVALAAHDGARVYHLGPERDRSVIEDRRLIRVATPEAADLLLNTGPDDQRDQGSLDGYLPDLRRCLQARLPMLCANPDLEIISGGQRLICAGVLGQWYERQGGVVRWIGKPYPEVYDLVWPMLDGVARSRVLAIGDSLRTDIAGAHAAGIDACWVLGGIHAHEDFRAAEAEARAADLAPVAMLPALIW